jgi:ABC-type phosphate transport system permease subunit
MYGAAGPPVTDGKAVASLVCGLVGILCFIPAIVAIVLGVSARGRIDASNGRLTGRGMAVAGMVLGIIGVVINVGYGVTQVNR